MILNCPSCDARYFIDDAAVTEAGRTVRCTACGYSWFARPTLDLAGGAGGELTREQVERARQGARQEPHNQIRDKQANRRKQARLMATLIAWSVVAVSAAGVAGAAYVFREDIVRAWPQASTAYASVGLPVNPYGLDFGPLTTERTFDGTTPVLSVQGVVRNTGTRPRSAPLVEISLFDEAGKALVTWTAPLDRATVAPGEEAVFSSRMESPPLEALRLDVAFVRPGPEGAGSSAASSRDAGSEGHESPSSGDHAQGDAHEAAANSHAGDDAHDASGGASLRRTSPDPHGASEPAPHE